MNESKLSDMIESKYVELLVYATPIYEPESWLLPPFELESVWDK